MNGHGLVQCFFHRQLNVIITQSYISHKSLVYQAFLWKSILVTSIVRIREMDTFEEWHVNTVQKFRICCQVGWVVGEGNGVERATSFFLE